MIRKIILEYFGDDVNALVPRPNCCDNCTRGLSAWRLSDLFEDVDDEGVHDFEKNAYTLLSVVKFLQQNGILVERKRTVIFLIGQYEEKLQKVLRTPLHGIGRNLSSTYWMALMQQLEIEDILDTKVGTTQYILTVKATEWMASPAPRTLRLKAIGPMYAFFEKKNSTPLTANTSVPSTNMRTPWNKFECDNEVLLKVLNDVKYALALRSNVEPDSVASSDALRRMIELKPKNYDEFRYASFDGFSIAKLHKYGPTFANVIAKYTVSVIDLLILTFYISKPIFS